jgi:predicted transcriptional regulator
MMRCAPIEMRGRIKITLLSRRSNISPQSFSSNYIDPLERGFIEETHDEEESRFIILTKKWIKYTTEYDVVLEFMNEFEL